LVARLERLLADVALPPTLEQCGVSRAALAHLAEEAAQQWTARFNPRPVDSAALQRMLLESWA
jgi:alcohol dehydrogenase